MSVKIEIIGIVGLGGFGRFLATLVPPGVMALGFDPGVTGDVPGVKKASLAETMAADVIVLAVPLSAYAAVLESMAPMLRPETLVIDVCSVKLQAEELLGKYLPGHENILLTHPLFGPQSARDGLSGHKLVVTGSAGLRAHGALRFAERTLGLEILRMSSEEHDRTMARVQALTFFVARGLASMGLGEEPIMTPSYQMIIDLVAFDATHSDDLFRTVAKGNRFAKAERQRLMDSLREVDKSL